MPTSSDFSDGPKIHTAGVLPIRQPPENQKLRLKDPALHVMTDFKSRIAITVAPEWQIDEALADMVRLGVRAMLVVRSGSVIGLVTSYDIEGSRSVQFAQPPHARRREDIRVGDVMTKWEDLPTLGWQTVQTARISDLLEIFSGVGVMHLVVLETDAQGAESVRGLISRSRIERQLHAENLLPVADKTHSRTNQNDELR
ncbi:MAG: CBS domain-containing protein [Gammaproteobacteria bacterium]